MTEDYQAKKFADVLCKEDKTMRLVMLPINQAQLWAKTEGEIRPAGRNPYAVWTPNALRRFLAQKGATVSGGRVRMLLAQMETAKPRDGNAISRYKINPLFFVRAKSVRTEGEQATFPLRISSRRAVCCRSRFGRAGRSPLPDLDAVSASSTPSVNAAASELAGLAME